MTNDENHVSGMNSLSYNIISITIHITGEHLTDDDDDDDDDYDDYEDDDDDDYI